MLYQAHTIQSFKSRTVQNRSLWLPFSLILNIWSTDNPPNVWTLQWRHMDIMTSQITGPSIVCITAYHWNIKAPNYWRFVRGIHCWPVSPLTKWPVTRKSFPCDDNPLHLEKNGLQHIYIYIYIYIYRYHILWINLQCHFNAIYPLKLIPEIYRWWLISRRNQVNRRKVT